MSPSTLTLDIEQVLARLRDRGCDPQPVRNHWVADCPICDDGGQGLVIFPESESQGLSIACDAGCSPTQVKDELHPAESMTLDALAGPDDERPPAEETEGRGRRAEHLSDAPSVYPEQAPHRSAHEATPRYHTAEELRSLYTAAGLPSPDEIAACGECGITGGEAALAYAEATEEGCIKFCPHDVPYLEPEEMDDDAEPVSRSTSRAPARKFVAFRTGPMLDKLEGSQLRPEAVSVFFWLALRMDYRTAVYDCTLEEIGAACFPWVKDSWRKTEKALVGLERAGAITRQKAKRNARTTIKLEWWEQVKATDK